MTSLILLLTYIMSFSSNTILSMLLFLIATYITAAIWLINHGVIYIGLLYILVYVGAIVVLIMFVVQLTNTTLNSSVMNQSNLTLIQNTVLIICLSLLMITALNHFNWSNFILSLTSLDISVPTDSTVELTSQIVETNNLRILASTIFNEYGYILILSVHAIILAVIGPVKLALQT